jgi:hypothetical protein
LNVPERELLIRLSFYGAILVRRRERSKRALQACEKDGYAERMVKGSHSVRKMEKRFNAKAF